MSVKFIDETDPIITRTLEANHAGPLLSLQFGTCHPFCLHFEGKIPFIYQALQLEFLPSFSKFPEHFIFTPYQSLLYLSRRVPGHPVGARISPLCIS